MSNFINEIKPFSTNTKPLLRWVGGKTWSLSILNSLVGKINYNNYFEPFFGGGAFFFSFNQKNNSYLSDLNKELIYTYEIIKNCPEKLIKKIVSFENSEEFYYRIRETTFTNKLDIAARFLYLNKTSFNGIYRVNKAGKYNVPYGKRAINHNEISNHIFLISEKLQRVNLFYSDFENTIGEVEKNDLIYLDPPYTVTHNDNGFIIYNEKLFSKADQKRLSSYIDKIKSKGAYYILSNANHEFVKDLFVKDDKLYELERASLISGKASSRGKYSEVIITNIK